MDYTYCTELLAENSEMIRSLVAGVSAEQARWKPDKETWSVVEILNHLVAEERGDFRVRLDLILHTPERPWPHGTPGWFIEGEYNERDLGASLSEFLSERKEALAWLDTLDAPDWNASVTTDFGYMRAGDVLASWVVHDQWHMQQLIQIRRAYTVTRLQPYDVTYAGSL